jgi:hypothetical protein
MHEVVCEQAQKRKAMGLGPTVRTAPFVRHIKLDQPIEIKSDVDQGLAGVTELLNE